MSGDDEQVPDCRQVPRTGLSVLFLSPRAAGAAGLRLLGPARRRERLGRQVPGRGPGRRLIAAPLFFLVGLGAFDYWFYWAAGKPTRPEDHSSHGATRWRTTSGSTPITR